MGNMEWIIGLGALAIGGWCFFWGPCKGWVNQLTNGAVGSGDGNFMGVDPAKFGADPSKIQRLARETNFDEELRAAQAKAKKEDWSPQKAFRIGSEIGQKYQAKYDSYYGNRVRLAI